MNKNFRPLISPAPLAPRITAWQRTWAEVHETCVPGPASNPAIRPTPPPHCIRRVTRITLVAIASITLSGCSMLSYTSPTGEHFSRNSLGAKTSISSLQLESGTNGIRHVDLRGYQQDTAAALAAVTEAAVKAALQAATK